MKKNFVISAILLGSLLACQKPSDTDNIAPQKFENATANDKKPPRGLNSYFYSAKLISTREKDSDNKIYESIGGNALYEHHESKAVAYTFVVIENDNSLTNINVIEDDNSFTNINVPQSFSIRSVVSDPATILNSVLNQYRVCTTPNPSITCVSPDELKSKIDIAFTDAQYDVISVSVSTTGNIEVVCRNTETPGSLASCIATIISYFN